MRGLNPAGRLPTLPPMRNPIIVALDLPDPDKALALARAVGPHVGAVKVGKELFVSAGPEIVRTLRAEGVAPECVVGWCAWSLGLVAEPRPLRAEELVARSSPAALREAALRTERAPTVFGAGDLAWLRSVR